MATDSVGAVPSSSITRPNTNTGGVMPGVVLVEGLVGVVVVFRVVPVDPVVEPTPPLVPAVPVDPDVDVDPPLAKPRLRQKDCRRYECTCFQADGNHAGLLLGTIMSYAGIEPVVKSRPLMESPADKMTAEDYAENLDRHRPRPRAAWRAARIRPTPPRRSPRRRWNPQPARAPSTRCTRWPAPGRPTPRCSG